MTQMRLKKISKRKKIKISFLIMLLYITFAYTLYYSFKSTEEVTNEKYINYLLNNGSALSLYDYKLSKVINKTLMYILKIDITKPETLFNGSIIGYHDNEEESTEDIEKLKKISAYMSDPNDRSVKDPIIYIYNSHQLENYNNNNLEIYGITPNVLMASYLLKEKLNDMGLSSIVEDANITEFLDLNNWDYTNSYRASRIFMLDKQNTYPTLKYFIDIHRDSVKKSQTTITINNKTYARILFVVGLEHNNYDKNLDLANKLNSMFEKNYPGLSRGVYKKEGYNVNGIYNQDISPNVMLIEVGGVDNNIDEVINTLNAISDILKQYIGDKY